MERRLAAVMIVDVAGYGRLGQADEEGTRARFQADLHEVFEPKIAAQKKRLRAEGHAVVTKGKRAFVADYEHRLAKR